jgi:hypothetical protein
MIPQAPEAGVEPRVGTEDSHHETMIFPAEDRCQIHRKTIMGGAPMPGIRPCSRIRVDGQALPREPDAAVPIQGVLDDIAGIVRGER